MIKYSLTSISKKLGISRKKLKDDMRCGRLKTGDGMVTYEQLERIYPNECSKLNSESDYYKALRETASNWKTGAKEYAEQMEKHVLVTQIRKLEAENHALKAHIAKLEKQKNS